MDLLSLYPLTNTVPPNRSKNASSPPPVSQAKSISPLASYLHFLAHVSNLSDSTAIIDSIASKKPSMITMSNGLSMDAMRASRIVPLAISIIEVRKGK